MNSWVWSVRPEHWDAVRDNGVLAVDSKDKGAGVSRGDRIVFYVIGTLHFQAAYEARTDWHRPTFRWPGEDRAGRRMRREIDLTEIRHGFASLDRLAPRLRFIEKKRYRGNYLRGSRQGPANSGKPISDGDYNLILRELARVRAAPGAGTGGQAAAGAPPYTGDLPDAGEHDVEYRQTLRYDARTGRASHAMEGDVMRELAGFMNAGGGRMLIGADGTGPPAGLGPDYATLRRKDAGGFQERITGLVDRHLGPGANSHVRWGFYTAGGVEICVGDVSRAPGPVFTSIDGEKRFYVRHGNTCRPYDIEEASRYISEHWR